jgi:hypothetical protein
MPLELFLKRADSITINNDQDDSTYASRNINTSANVSPSSVGDKVAQLRTPCASQVKDDKMEQLLKDLDFIDQPLVPRRVRSRKSQLTLPDLSMSKHTSDARTDTKLT